MIANAAMALLLVAGLALGAVRTQPPKTNPPLPPAKDPGEARPTQPKVEEDSSYVLGFKMKRIDGKEEDLAQYKGKVVVIVNVASQCGYTPQYEALEKLYESKKDQGLIVLGFPANNFGKQEPGTNEEITKFCSDKYSVTFPLFEKISVKGADQHALYKKLSGQPAPVGGDPKWNFTKFVVDRTGHVVAHIDAKTRPALEPDLLKKIDELLGDQAEKPKGEQPKSKPASTG